MPLRSILAKLLVRLLDLLLIMVSPHIIEMIPELRIEVEVKGSARCDAIDDTGCATEERSEGLWV